MGSSSPHSDGVLFDLGPYLPQGLGLAAVKRRLQTADRHPSPRRKVQRGLLTKPAANPIVLVFFITAPAASEQILDMLQRG